MAGSVWATLGTGAGLSGKQRDRLQRLFAYRGARALKGAASGAAGARPAAPRRRAELISTKRAQNIAICLTKVTAMPYEAMAAAVRDLNATGSLGWEDAAALRQIAPTAEEGLAVRALLEDLQLESCGEGRGGVSGAALRVAGLSTAEQFVVHMAEVPWLERKLQVIVLMQLFRQLVAATRQSIAELQAAAEQVQASPTLRACLGLCLKVGNALNEGTARGNARGFEVRVLPSLAALKSSTNTNYSLMHMLAAELGRELRVAARARRRGEAEAEEGCGGAEKEKGEEGEEESEEEEGEEEEAEEAELAELGAGEGGEGGDCGLEAVLQLRSELCALCDGATAADALGGIEVQLGQLRSELYQVHAELAQLPAVPPRAAFCDGSLRVRTLDESRLLLSFACDDVSTVWWVLLPRYLREPKISWRGAEQRTPTPAELRAGCGADDCPALAHGSVEIDQPEIEHHVVVHGVSPTWHDKWPRTCRGGAGALEFTVFAVVQDACGWEAEAPALLSPSPSTAAALADASAATAPADADAAVVADTEVKADSNAANAANAATGAVPEDGPAAAAAATATTGHEPWYAQARVRMRGMRGGSGGKVRGAAAEAPECAEAVSSREESPLCEPQQRRAPLDSAQASGEAEAAAVAAGGWGLQAAGSEQEECEVWGPVARAAPAVVSLKLCKGGEPLEGDVALLAQLAEGYEPKGASQCGRLSVTHVSIAPPLLADPSHLDGAAAHAPPPTTRTTTTTTTTSTATLARKKAFVPGLHSRFLVGGELPTLVLSPSVLAPSPPRTPHLAPQQVDAFLALAEGEAVAVQAQNATMLQQLHCSLLTGGLHSVRPRPVPPPRWHPVAAATSHASPQAAFPMTPTPSAFHGQAQLSGVPLAAAQHVQVACRPPLRHLRAARLCRGASQEMNPSPAPSPSPSAPLTPHPHPGALQECSGGE